MMQKFDCIFFIVAQISERSSLKTLYYDVTTMATQFRSNAYIKRTAKRMNLPLHCGDYKHFLAYHLRRYLKNVFVFFIHNGFFQFILKKLNYFYVDTMTDLRVLRADRASQKARHIIFDRMAPSKLCTVSVDPV